MRYNKRTDGNQSKLVKQLKERFFNVTVTSHLGWGFMDLIVVRNGKGKLVEVKDKGKMKNLTQKEIEMRDLLVKCGAKYVIAETVEDIEKSFK